MIDVRVGARYRVGAMAVLSVTAFVGLASSWGSSAGAQQRSSVSDPAVAAGGARLGRELPLLRTRSSRTYVDAAGTRTATVYGSSVHFREGGRWKSIDSRLEAVGGKLRNRANRYQLQLPTNASAGPVEISQGGDSVAFGLRGVASAPAVVAGAEATYRDARPGVDLSYAAIGDAVKESLVLKRRGTQRVFVFDLDVSAGLTPRLRASKVIELVNSDGRVPLTIAAPYMVDAAGKSSTKVAYELERVGSDWTLVVSAGDAWLDAPGRRFPVVVDPTVYAGDIGDCEINSASADSSLCATDSLNVGYANQTRYRSLVKFNVRDVVPADSRVLYSAMGLFLRAQSTTNAKRIVARTVTSGWDGAATWTRRDAANQWGSPGADFDSTDVEFNPTIGAAGSAGRYHWWNVRDATEAWLEGPDAPGGKQNLGFVLKDEDDTVNQLTFNSIERPPSGTDAPYLIIQYTPHLGRQRGFKFEEFGLTDRISLGVNAATGNAILSQRDLTIAGGLGPDLTVGRTYQSLDYETRTMSMGWRLDVGGDVRLEKLANEDVILHAPTGSRILFDRLNDGSFVARPGIDATLEQNADGSYKLIQHQSQTRYSFDGDGRLLSQTDRNDRRIRYEYAAAGAKLSRIVDSQDRNVDVAYDASGRLSKLTDPAGREYVYAYNAAGELSSYADPAGGVTRYEYNGGYGLSKIITPAGRQTRIAHFASGDPNQLRVKTVTRVSDTAAQSGPTTAFTYAMDYPKGTGWVSDPIGTSTTDPNDRMTTYAFDQHGRITKVTDPQGREQKQEYTSQSRVNAYFAPYNSSTTASVKLNYDSDSGNLLGTTTATDNSSGGNPLLSSFAYNEAGRIPTGTPGARYLQTSSNNEQGRSAYATYDANGNPKQNTVIDAAGQDVAGVRFDYDPGAAGKMIASYDGNDNKTSYAYDVKGNLTSVTPPMPLGATVFNYAGASGKDQALSRVSYTQDPDNRRATFEYDALDRLTKTTWSDGSSVTNTYDQDGFLTQRLDSEAGTTSYTYDQLGRIDYESYPGARFNDYGYDLNSNLASAQDQGGTTTYSYDTVNRQTEVRHPGTTQPIAFSYLEDAARNETTISLPNSVSVEQKYDKAGRMLSTCARPSANADACTNSTPARLSAFNWSFAQGSSQRALAQTETDKDGLSTTYTYDELDRLRSAARSDGKTWTYDLDDAGNVTQRSATGEATQSLAYNAANQLTSSTGQTFSYDQNGNETGGTGPRTNATINARNQITSTTSAAGTLTRSYAGPGQAEDTTLGTQAIGYSALGLTQADSTRFTRDENGSLLAQRDGSATSYTILDRLGSVRALIDEGGAVVRRQNYDPYGTITTSTGSRISTLGYAGGLRASDGLLHYGQRHYDPTLMRWTQRDPLNQSADLRQANLYSYVGGDPINLIDPTGEHIFGDALKAGSAIVSKLATAASAAFCGVTAAMSASNKNASYKGTLKSIPKGGQYFVKDFYNCYKAPFFPRAG